MADLENKTNQTELENQNTGNQQEPKQEPTMDELLNRIAALETESKQKDATIKKLNLVKDESLKKIGDLTKQVRAKMDAEELANEAAKEEEEARKQRDAEKDLIIARYQARDMFRSMGMDGELLEKTIEAKIAGDESTVNINISKHYEVQQEKALKDAKAEWLQSRPPVNAGVDDSSGGITQEQFNRMGYAQRVAFKQQHPEAYKKYSE